MARNQQLSPYRGGETTRGIDPYTSLHREMNRLFDDVFRGFMPAFGRQGGEQGGMMQPEIDVSETEKEFKICADLPGVSEQDVDVRLDDDVLTIRAERRQEHKEDKEDYHVVERSHGMFQRSLRLPSGIDAEKVQADFENGVLTVRVPKTEEAQRSRRIQIQGKAGGKPAAERQAGSGQKPEGQKSQGQQGQGREQQERQQGKAGQQSDGQRGGEDSSKSTGQGI